MFYLKVTLGKMGKVVGPFLDEKEREEAMESVRKSASSIICHNNQTLSANGLQIDSISSLKKLDTVSKADLMFFFTNISLDAIGMAA